MARPCSASDRLAAWLAVYAAGSLVVLADAGLQMRAINRFLSFKSCADCDGRTASFYARMLRIYLALVLATGLAILAMVLLWPPSQVLGFQATPGFDSALIVMTLGTVFILPSNLVSGLYRVRGKYGRSVWLQNGALLLGQIAQLVAIATFGSLLAGWLAGSVGVRAVVLGSGVLVAAGGLAFATQLPRLRRHARPVYARLGILPEVAGGVNAATELPPAGRG